MPYTEEPGLTCRDLSCRYSGHVSTSQECKPTEPFLQKATLCGNVTPQPLTDDAANGFNALSSFDAPRKGGNGDGVIDARDAVFASLRLWWDESHDGASQPGELHTLPSLDVLSIHLDYKESKRKDTYGNEFRYRAKIDDAKGARVNRWA